MARYEYRCPECGPFDVALPMGTAGTVRTCPDCGAQSRRRWTAPSLNSMDRNQVRHRLREEASRDAPEVVTSVPPAARRRRHSTDPRQAALPRP